MCKWNKFGFRLNQRKFPLLLLLLLVNCSPNTKPISAVNHFSVEGAWKPDVTDQPWLRDKSAPPGTYDRPAIVFSNDHRVSFLHEYMEGSWIQDGRKVVVTLDKRADILVRLGADRPKGSNKTTLYISRDGNRLGWSLKNKFMDARHTFLFVRVSSH